MNCQKKGIYIAGVTVQCYSEMKLLNAFLLFLHYQVTDEQEIKHNRRRANCSQMTSERLLR